MSDAWAILGQETYKGVINGVVYGPHTVCCVGALQVTLFERTKQVFCRMSLLKILSPLPLMPTT